jgi:hypothetical protein
MEPDIQKLRQKAYCFDYDNYGLDVADYPEDDDDALDDEDDMTVLSKAMAPKICRYCGAVNPVGGSNG